MVPLLNIRELASTEDYALNKLTRPYGRRSDRRKVRKMGTDVLQPLYSLWTGNRGTVELPEAIEKLTVEEQQEIRAYCENTERQAFDVGFKTAVQLWNQLDNTGGIMK